MGAVAVNTFIISFLLYGQKAIRMLAYPERNTREYFQEQRMLEMQAKVNQTIQSVIES